MRRNRPYIRYLVLFVCTFFLDRITKFFVLSYDIKRCVVAPFLSLELCFNRGMSWGLLHSEGTAQFLFVSFLTVAIILFLIFYTLDQWKKGASIGGEVLALSGAISNLIDRTLYGGVVDFISLSYHGWSWPVFNIADSCVVIGVFLIIVGFSRKG